MKNQQLNSMLKLAKAKSNLTDAKSNYDFIKNEIDKTNIIAPYNGILTSDHLEAGEFVQVGTTLSTFVELDPMLVVGYVSEKELKNVCFFMLLHHHFRFSKTGEKPAHYLFSIKSISLSL